MTERIMYCCTGCIDHAPEGCGYFDRTMLRLMPDDRWLCDACFDDDPLEDRDGIMRMLGSRDGLLHALVLVESVIQRYHGQYRGNFDPRHVRKIKERDGIVAPMREIAKILDTNMRECLRVYQKNHDELEARQAPATPLHQDKTHD